MIVTGGKLKKPLQAFSKSICIVKVCCFLDKSIFPPFGVQCHLIYLVIRYSGQFCWYSTVHIWCNIWFQLEELIHNHNACQTSSRSSLNEDTYPCEAPAVHLIRNGQNLQRFSHFLIVRSTITAIINVRIIRNEHFVSELFQFLQNIQCIEDPNIAADIQSLGGAQACSETSSFNSYQMFFTVKPF